MTAPDAPREAEVRAWLENLAALGPATSKELNGLVTAALALLDAGREDREDAERWRALLKKVADETLNGTSPRSIAPVGILQARGS